MAMPATGELGRGRAGFRANLRTGFTCGADLTATVLTAAELSLAIAGLWGGGPSAAISAKADMHISGMERRRVMA
ncbi:hypothetical protein [Sphingobium boeckii]|uniref:Uncharacterized protein n=1 Tax=Sphingobium boeckii TaxID=1082345 RepID=A0A7W9AKR9_9SPHN|nr:hypothetical protein [Sphingobium boeckii]MBB5687490.1 hypothetical protein [Sphingobium boeckii]